MTVAERRLDFKLTKDTPYPSYGMSVMRMLKKNDRVITASRCIMFQSGEDATMLVEQYHMTTWAANRELPHSMQAFCRLVAMLVAWRRENEEGIITVQCRYVAKKVEP